MGIEAEERAGIHLDINRFYWVELRKILWKHSISPQEFFSFIIKLLVTGDQRIHDILKETKRARAKKETLNIVHTDEESLYELIEQNKGRKAEG